MNEKDKRIGASPRRLEHSSIPEHNTGMPLDREAVFDLTCPKCGHKFEQSTGRMRAKPKFSCPKCRQLFDAKKLNIAIEKTVEDIRSEFRRALEEGLK